MLHKRNDVGEFCFNTVIIIIATILLSTFFQFVDKLSETYINNFIVNLNRINFPIATFRIP